MAFFSRVVIIVFFCWFPLWVTKKLFVWYDPDASDKIRASEKERLKML